MKRSREGRTCEMCEQMTVVKAVVQQNRAQRAIQIGLYGVSYRGSLVFSATSSSMVVAMRRGVLYRSSLELHLWRHVGRVTKQEAKGTPMCPTSLLQGDLTMSPAVQIKLPEVFTTSRCAASTPSSSHPKGGATFSRQFRPPAKLMETASYMPCRACS